MRRVVLFLSFALVLAGPLVYFTVGERARSQRRAALQNLAAQQEKVAAALAAASGGRPPSRQGIAAIEDAIAQRRGTLSKLTSSLLAFRSTPSPVEAELRTIARAAGLDASLLEAVLASMPDGALGEQRRHVLGLVFGALKRSPGTTLRAIKVARELSTPRTSESAAALGGDDLDMPLRSLRIDLEARGDATALVQFVDHLLATGPGVPLTDLAHLDLAPDLTRKPASDANAAGDLPPLVLHLVVDAFVAEAK